jgi:hypothetical protein
MEPSAALLAQHIRPWLADGGDEQQHLTSAAPLGGDIVILSFPGAATPQQMQRDDGSFADATTLAVVAQTDTSALPPLQYRYAVQYCAARISSRDDAVAAAKRRWVTAGVTPHCFARLRLRRHHLADLSFRVLCFNDVADFYCAPGEHVYSRPSPWVRYLAPPRPAACSDVEVSELTHRSVAVRWRAPSNAGIMNQMRFTVWLRACDSQGADWRRVAATTERSAAVDGLHINALYDVTVSASSTFGAGAKAKPRRFRTLGRIAAGEQSVARYDPGLRVDQAPPWDAVRLPFPMDPADDAMPPPIEAPLHSWVHGPAVVLGGGVTFTIDAGPTAAMLPTPPRPVRNGAPRPSPAKVPRSWNTPPKAVSPT